jgi:DNA adenine methylase
MKPFLKWVGGKTQLLPTILQCLPEQINNYYEPFVGGGALFFGIPKTRYKKAHLNDLNSRLIDTYTAVRDNLVPLEEELRRLQIQYGLNGRETFKAIKAVGLYSPDATTRAAAFIFLNKTGFNGLYRVNKKDEYNVPWGQYLNPTILNIPVLRGCKEALQGTNLTTGDFEGVIKDAGPGDFCYFDPPYVPVSKTANFRNYGPAGFKYNDQRRLARVFTELADKGVQVMASNSDVATVRELYGQHQIVPVEMPRAINSKGTGRGKVGEVLITANLAVPQDLLRGPAPQESANEGGDPHVFLDDIESITEHIS